MWVVLSKENIYIGSCGEAKPKINGMSIDLVEQMTKPTDISVGFLFTYLILRNLLEIRGQKGEI